MKGDDEFNIYVVSLNVLVMFPRGDVFRQLHGVKP